MRIRSAGLAALVAAAGIWMSFSGEPAMAAKSTAAKAAKSSVATADRPIVLSKFKKQRAHAAKKSRTAQARQAKRATSKASSKAKVLAEKSADKSGAAGNKVVADASKSELPVSVANARAQALAVDQARNIAALDSTDVAVVDGMQLASADQLTDADRAATADAAVAQDLIAPTPPVAAPPSPSAPSSKILRPVSTAEKPVLKTDDSDPWSKTSLIGKIFIAFGSLLTLASAARLMIA
ncbi:hypothetical protein YH63_021260 [Afipia massiliensis]|uniref:Uncharacterized protein n=2 Tax=Afipia massiliensis TaxID=211460 RepID=A0A4U6BWB2_9BRAD|nr:hypothetical protein YH63_021260 [Afipia massiliensis]